MIHLELYESSINGDHMICPTDCSGRSYDLSLPYFFYARYQTLLLMKITRLTHHF